MPRYKKHSHQIPENFRRKCEDTQSVKQVQHRYNQLNKFNIDILKYQQIGHQKVKKVFKTLPISQVQ